MLKRGGRIHTFKIFFYTEIFLHVRGLIVQQWSVTRGTFLLRNIAVSCQFKICTKLTEYSEYFSEIKLFYLCRDIRSGNEESAFRIVQDGSLRTAKKFNHKVRDQYILQIRVFDNGTPPLYSDSYGKMTKYQFIFGKNKNMFSFQCSSTLLRRASTHL